jgi:folate-binding protein YgfZ
LLETVPRVLQKLQAVLSRYKIREKITIEPVTDLGSIGVQGPNSPSLIAKISQKQLPKLNTYSHATIEFEGAQVILRRQSETGEEGYILTTPAVSLTRTWEGLLRLGVGFNASLIGSDAQESLRIEAGIPRYGLDLSDENIPLEIENQDMISFTKGCYVGQEVIARLKFLGQANKHLKGLIFTGQDIPTPNAKVMKKETEVGKVTSSTFSPTLKRAIAMAYIRREYSTTGTQVSVQSNGTRLTSTVADLPFIKR